MIYVTCRYAPLELIEGFHEETQRLDMAPSSFTCSDECAHPNLCGYAKAVIEEVHARQIKALVMTDCCDAMRRTYDVLKESGVVEFLYLLPLPHKRTDAEIRLFRSALTDLKDQLEAYLGKPFDAEEAVNACKRREKEYHKADRPYISISGAHGGSHLIEQVRRTFDDIDVRDDTCTGNRHLACEAGSADSFFDWYPQALLLQTPACMRMWHNDLPAAEDPTLVKGIVYHTVKFCDYYSFAYMQQKQTTIPIVKIETDTSLQSDGQLKTRLEAFREELGMEKKEKIVTVREGPVYTAGIDSGSASTDAVVMDQNQNIIGRAIIPTGQGARSTSERALSIALKEAGLEEKDLTAVVSTGYGRKTTGIQSTSVTEITCHAKGAHFLDPDARTVIDIGGQDSKVIRIDDKGSVKNFTMNDKCAAGTGRFLEMQARALGMSMEEMSEKGLQWKKDVNISSMCTVFAESEVVSLVAQNVPAEDIIHGLNKAIAAKTAGLMARLGKQPGYIMTGGVAQNKGVVQCLEDQIGEKIFVSDDAQICGAIGAALIALDSVREGQNESDH